MSLVNEHQLAVLEIRKDYESLSIVEITQLYNEGTLLICMIFTSSDFLTCNQYKECRKHLQTLSGSKTVLRRLLFEVKEDGTSYWRAEFTSNKSEKAYANELKIRQVGKRKFLEERQRECASKITHIEVKRDQEIHRVVTSELKTTDIPRKIFALRKNITRKLFNGTRVNKRILFQLLHVNSPEYIRSQYSRFVKAEDVIRPVIEREETCKSPKELEILNPTGLVQEESIYEKIEDQYFYSNLRTPESIEMAFDYLSSKESTDGCQPVYTIKAVPSEVYRIKLHMLGITDEVRLKNFMRKFFSCDSGFEKALRVRNRYLNLVEDSTGKYTSYSLKTVV